MISLNALDRALEQQNITFGTEFKKIESLEKQKFMSYKIEARFMNTLSNMQYAQYNSVDPIFLWPLQPVIGNNGGKIGAQPINDLMYTFPKIIIKTDPIKIKKYEMSGTIKSSFGGIAFAGGFLSLQLGFIEIKNNHREFLIGQKAHPYRVEDIAVEFLSFNEGAPLIPCYALHPQIKWREHFDSISLVATLMSQYLFTDNGPDGFSSAYLKQSGIPQCNLLIEYKKNSLFLGCGINYKRLTPITETPIYLKIDGAQNQEQRQYNANISFFIYSLYGSYTSQIGAFKSQLFIGSNGTDMYLLGGYALSNFTRFQIPATFAQNKPFKFTPIRFISFWTNFEPSCTLWRLKPSIFCGYTQLLGSPEKIALDPVGKPRIYTIDAAAFKTTLINPLNRTTIITESIFGTPLKYITSLIRFTPRLWLKVSEKINLGLEINTYRVIFGDLREYSKPVNTSKSIFIATSIGGSFEY